MSVAGSKNADVPIGVVLPYGGFIAPQGGWWLVCDGSVFDPVEYSVLYGVIGTQFGGTAQAPLLPNLLGKYGFGFQSGVNNVGQSIPTGVVGVESFTLQANNIPSLTTTPSPVITGTTPDLPFFLNVPQATGPSGGSSSFLSGRTEDQAKVRVTTTITGADITRTNASPDAVSFAVEGQSISFAGYEMTYIIKAKGF